MLLAFKSAKAVINSARKKLSFRKSNLAVSDSPFHNRFPSALPADIVNKRIYLSSDHRFMYFRIPKAANSYMLANLLLNSEGQELNLAEVDKLKEKKSTCHLIGAGELDRVIESFFKFTIVRNPYSRVLSAYLDKIGREKKQIAKVLERLNMPCGTKLSLEEFIEYLELDGALYDDPHWARQTDLIPIPNAYLDFIGRFETLGTDTPIILNKIFGCENYRKMANEHATSADLLVEDMLTDDLKNRIYILYREDFDRFGYSK